MSTLESICWQSYSMITRVFFLTFQHAWHQPTEEVQHGQETKLTCRHRSPMSIKAISTVRVLIPSLHTSSIDDPPCGEKKHPALHSTVL
jgi:hypothetical protein